MIGWLIGLEARPLPDGRIAVRCPGCGKTYALKAMPEGVAVEELRFPHQQACEVGAQADVARAMKEREQVAYLN